ncbi:hypothetical protein C1637_24115 [Chryseobacterium lactis]|uniref:Helix-turn-helix domain-containing protein n=1 Tax=Chryseobacterium lactis TaxID=1241981 RepID=A0A3G6RFS7_CHRLC|nr:helix-turn-helix domain-containing protein [Chryseobacterium lactis]AZA83240.1 helix-turn-helix domain-containing protein [Chryseobacterium lactis]AZB03625.1 helix-turn-helix domain-containing protein [Chryseobacterium lactis]PNW11165.1 hypothetical protein C1637_24115 [Chryseobacterium lactis]
MRIYLLFLFATVIAFQAFDNRPFEMVDAILKSKNKWVSKAGKIQPKYDAKEEITWNDELERANKENSHLKESHATEKRLYSVVITTILIILAGLMHIIFTTYHKKIYYKGLYLEVIRKREGQNNVQTIPELKNEGDIFELKDINPLIVERILCSLEAFEKEKKYLNKGASLINLAKECGTNTSYMSKVINHYKKQNFASYLNDLRLKYAVELWENHPKLRYKSIQGMAEMTGFNTVQSFSKKFQEKYKIPPTHFLKNLSQNIKAS